ncbi:MAG: SMP-30/gluconolactonase/LRE family protein [Verrucomicrobia bacterium]|nr:SMP-30/gluconolactonase/LRE family protein [Verrucomicrobiota bacterium]
MKKLLSLLACAVGILSAPAQDMALSMLLIDGEDWKLAVDNVQFPDGPTADAQGNFYFCEMRSTPPVIWKITSAGMKSKLIEGTSASGLKFGPDGRLYACVGKDKQLVAFDIPSGKKTVIAEDVQPNDLVVSAKGHIYITETGKKQVTFVNAKTGEKKAVYAAPVPAPPADTGGKKKAAPAPYDPKIINAPNGITLSPDQGTLAVSDVRGQFTWAFRVEADGSLSAGAPYMTMRTPVDIDAKSADGRTPIYKTASGGDGMTSDTQGRYYVSSHLGVQVFDPTGRMSGVLPNPGDKGMTSVGFAGPHMEFMYVTCGDKIFRRKVQASGNRFFLPPGKTAAPAKKK